MNELPPGGITIYCTSASHLAKEIWMRQLFLILLAV